jgi:hypothetical protein
MYTKTGDTRPSGRLRKTTVLKTKCAFRRKTALRWGDDKIAAYRAFGSDRLRRIYNSSSVGRIERRSGIM